MSTKHLYDSANGLVLKSLRGAVYLNPAIHLHDASRTVYMPSHSPTKRVAVISGGGSGHEPAHASYTGAGMLSASVAGDIFASPSAKQILSTIELAALSGHNPSRDVLMIINNYTGDRLNFGLAIEKARFAVPGVQIESVIVADDVALLQQNADNKFVGPRGLGANILVCKILGALAEKGECLAVVKAYGDAVVENLFSLGIGLDHCHVPGRTKEGRSILGEHECEVGLGLHNEPGFKKQQIGEPEELIDHMVEIILDAQSRRTGVSTFREDKEGVVLFINNLGGMSQLEMGAVVDDVVRRFAVSSICPRRIYCSSYMTSLNAPGFSISVLDPAAIRNSLQAKHPELTGIDLDELLDAPTDALAWIGARTQWKNGRTSTEDRDVKRVLSAYTNYAGEVRASKAQFTIRSLSRIENSIRQACLSVLKIRDQLTEFDTIVGDGDCGDTFAAGANGVLLQLNSGTLVNKDIDLAGIVRNVADILEDCMGGTIGAFFAIFLNALSSSLSQDENAEPFGRALQNAKKTLSRYTPAEIGDRTIMDCLGPFCDAIARGETTEMAVNKARAGFESTRGMKAHLGRAVYLNLAQDMPPDPGAMGVSAILDGLLEGSMM